jgi:hypothetical protein
MLPCLVPPKNNIDGLKKFLVKKKKSLLNQHIMPQKKNLPSFHSEIDVALEQQNPR